MEAKPVLRGAGGRGWLVAIGNVPKARIKMWECGNVHQAKGARVAII